MNFIYRVLLGIVILALVEFYIYKRISNSAGVVMPGKKPYVKIILNSLLLWTGLYPLILIILLIYSSVSGVRVQTPENLFFDYLVLYPFWAIFLFMVQSALIFLVIDFLRLILLPLYKKYNEKLKPAQAWIVLAAAGFFLLYVPLRIVYDYYTVDITSLEYKKENLAGELEGFKLVLIADIQADRYTDKSRLSNYISKVNELKPDLVLIAGDVITSTPNYIKTSAEYIGMIEAKYGVYACVGDHDNWAYREDTRKSIREIQEALLSENVLMINNGKKIIDVNGAEVRVTFITNTYVEKIPAGVLDSIANHNLNYDLLVFLTHQPRPYLMASAKKYNYDLFLAGHTHGGQVSFAFPFYRLSPTLFETTYVRGDFYMEDLLIYVNRGLGMSLAPIRYNSTPEITEIILRKK